MLTDNEIIKALEYCEDSADTDKHCLKCPYCNESYCLDKMMADALSLINRQKAEIERLQEKNKRLFAENVGITHSSKEIKAEAIKEFAERFKGLLDTELRWCECVDEIIKPLDNLVKEMVGDENAND